MFFLPLPKQHNEKYNKLRPDHKQYIKNLEIKEEADEQEVKEMTMEFEKIEKERLNEVRQVQEIQSRPPKFIFINKYLIDLIFPIIKIIFKFRIINRLADKEFDKISKGFDKVKLEV